MENKTNISREAAQELLKLDNQELKAFALELYPDLGKLSFKEIDTFEKVLAYHGKTADMFYTDIDLTDQERAFRELLLITSALNGGVEIDMEGDDQVKWELWWSFKGGFSLDRVYSYCSHSDVPPSLLYVTREIAEHSAKHFFTYWKRWIYGKDI